MDERRSLGSSIELSHVCLCDFVIRGFPSADGGRGTHVPLHDGDPHTRPGGKERAEGRLHLPLVSRPPCADDEEGDQGGGNDDGFDHFFLLRRDAPWRVSTGCWFPELRSRLVSTARFSAHQTSV
jgi:hypothetical protein